MESLVNTTVDIPESLWPFVILLAIWSLAWKSLALWHSARKGDEVWFVILFVVNTAGILDIVYLAQSGRLKLGKLFGK